MKGEDRFVQKLRAFLPPSPNVLVGPGDDAAVVSLGDGAVVATTDILVESIDYLPSEPPESVGRRAVAVNCSDLAAMGARPAWFLLAIAFPPERGEEFPLAVARGAAQRGRELGAHLIGGDLSRAPTVMLCISLWGRLISRPLLRSGASTGDLLFVSGSPGRAAAGLQIAKHGPGKLRPEHVRELLAAYRDPEPRVSLGTRLAAEGLATAAIDVSDGLGLDAGRLARASGVRIVIERDRLPVAPALAAIAAETRSDPLRWILAGGDDYELLFTAPSAAERELTRKGAEGVAVTRIGRVETGEGALLEDRDGTRDVSEAGYDHFEASP